METVLFCTGWSELPYHQFARRWSRFFFASLCAKSNTKVRYTSYLGKPLGEQARFDGKLLQVQKQHSSHRTFHTRQVPWAHEHHVLKTTVCENNCLSSAASRNPSRGLLQAKQNQHNRNPSIPLLPFVQTGTWRPSPDRRTQTKSPCV